jgi:sodium/proline symporter
MDYLVLLGFIAYFIIVLFIGYYFYNKSHGLSDYLLGGRKLNPYVAALSAQASDMSGWLLLGLPGSIFAAGIGGAWIGIGLAVGS